MPSFLARRLAQAVAVVAGVVVLTFLIGHVLPGDPAVAVVGPKASAAQLAAARRQYGLDRSLPVQLWRYVVQLLHGRLGTSLHTHRPVTADLKAAVPATIELVAVALLLAVAVGVPLGVVAARYRRRPGDGVIRVQSMLAVSVPVFWLALVLQELFATRLGWFPVAGEYDPTLDSTHPLHLVTNITLVDSVLTGNWAIAASVLHHVVLPAVTLAAYPAGLITQLTRASMIEEMGTDHVRLERSLGFSERSILVRFALRPALNPVVAVIALVFASSIVNSFLVEAVFDWPGLGQYAVASISALDTPAITGITLVVAIAYVSLNLLVDIAQHAIDPRVGAR